MLPDLEESERGGGRPNLRQAMLGGTRPPTSQASGQRIARREDIANLEAGALVGGRMPPTSRQVSGRCTTGREEAPNLDASEWPVASL
jgi:hypothetical protein